MRGRETEMRERERETRERERTESERVCICVEWAVDSFYIPTFGPPIFRFGGPKFWVNMSVEEFLHE